VVHTDHAITGFKVMEPESFLIMLCSPSIQQSNSYKNWDPDINDSILALLQHWRGNNVYHEMPDFRTSKAMRAPVCATARG
jgi:hypothetical protein